jgi:hypothetical protein
MVALVLKVLGYLAAAVIAYEARMRQLDRDSHRRCITAPLTILRSII